MAHKDFGYPVGHHSDECMDDGVGCDGQCGCGEYCDCHCHGDTAPMFETDDDVREWHDA
jgi:hypothetical protein